MKSDHVIMAVHVTDRLVNAPQVQGLLTEYGANIKTRLGLHEVEEGSGGPNGILILELVGCTNACDELQSKLNAIAGIEARTISFSH